MIDWGEGDFFIAKSGAPSVLTRNPTTKRWFKAVSVGELRRWWQRYPFDVQQELRHTLYIGDGVQMYHLCVKYFLNEFLEEYTLKADHHRLLIDAMTDRQAIALNNLSKRS